MNSTTQVSRRVVALLATAVLLAGCAVLTIDVDVYKGPLANHPAVQARQLEGVVMGALPLLVELRVDLEIAKREDAYRLTNNELDALEDALSEDGFIASPPDGWWYSYEAKTVDQILGLYKDLKEVQKIANARRESDDGASNQSPDSAEVDRRARILADGTDAGDRAIRALHTMALTAEDRALTDRIQSLDPSRIANRGFASAIAGFLASEYRPVKPVMTATGFDAEAEEVVVANAAYATLLRMSQLRNFDARLDTGSARVGNRIQAICEAFFFCSDAFVDLWTALMEGLVELNRAAETLDSNERAEAAELAEALVNYSLEVIQPLYVRMALEITPGLRPPLAQLSEDLRDAVPQLNGWTGADYAAAKSVLRRRLLRDRGATASALLDLQHEVQSDVFLAGLASRDEIALSKRFASAWERGLVRAPADLSSDGGDGLPEFSIEAFRDLVATLKSAFGGSDSIAERGRPWKGLATLIEAYIDAIEADGRPDAEGAAADKARFELVQGLIPFAQKVLFVANNRELVEGQERGTRESKRKGAAYRQFLQAVGNSIIIQANELEYRDDHHSASARVGSETSAIDAAFTGSASAIVGRLYALLSDDLRAAEAERDALNVQIRSLEDNDPNKTTLAQRRDELAETVAGLKGAIAFVESQGNWAAARGADPASSRSVVDALLANVPDDQPTTKATLDRYRYSIISLNEVGASGVTPETRRQAVDELIAALDYQRMRVIEERGANSPDAQRLSEAINAAYERRSTMIFIRPSSAYLRSSYPATDLQDNPGGQWDNMLGKHALRSIPFAPQFRDAFDPQGKDNARIQNNIDKRYWQNINRVRVAGGGDVNYAIAKDDIGNWYVKSYSADPKVVIQSARNLALFNMGTAMGTNLLNRVPADVSSKDPVTRVDPANPPTSWRGQQFVQFQAADLQRAGSVYDDARKILTALKGSSGSLQTAWTSIDRSTGTDLDSVLTSAQTAISGDPPAKAADAKARGEAILLMLQRLAEFDRAATSALRTMQATYVQAIESARAGSLAAEQAARDARDQYDAKINEATTLEQRVTELTAALGELGTDSAARAPLQGQIGTAGAAATAARSEATRLETVVNTTRETAGTKRTELVAAETANNTRITGIELATQALDTAVRRPLRELIERRKAEVATYRSVIEVLGTPAGTQKTE